MKSIEYNCVFCGKRLRGRKKKFCNNSCKCKYFYKNHPDRCNIWYKNHPRPKVNHNCITCGKPCGRKKYCSDKCKPKLIYIPKEDEYKLMVNRINNKCEVCGKTIFILHVHHINGNHNDNSIENLAVVCPSCHARVHNPSNKQVKTTKFNQDRENRIREFQYKLRGY